MEEKNTTHWWGFSTQFEIEGHEIDLHSSAITGSHSIYINTKLYKKWYYWGLKTQRDFQLGSNRYDAVFHLKNVLIWRALHQIFSGKKLIREAEVCFFTKHSALIVWSLSGLLGFFIGYNIQNWG